MIPLRIRMKNFLSYRGETPVFEFASIHIAVLSGENGSGKSSFLEAIHWAVWGKARLRDSEIIHMGETHMYVEFEFAVNQNTYRIHRSFVAGRRGGSKLELYQATDTTRTHWASLTKNTSNETQSFIITAVVGMSYDVFANSAYLRQGQADAFTQLTPAERREILAQILEIDIYETYREQVKTRRDTLRIEEATLKTQMRTDEETAATIPQLTQQLSDAEVRRDNALLFLSYAETVLSLQHTRVTLATTTAHHRDVTQVMTQLDTDIAHISTALAQRATIETQYHQLEALEQQARALRGQRAQFEQLSTQRHAAQTEITAASHILDMKIVTLTQQITHLADTLTHHADARARYNQLEAQIATHDTDPTRVAHIHTQRQIQQAAITSHQHAIQRIHTLTKEQQQLQQRIDELERATQPWDTLTTRLAEGESAQKRLRQLEQQRTQYGDAVATTHAHREIIKQRGLDMRDKKAVLTINQPCPTCQTMMDEAHYTMAVANFDNEITHLREQYTALTTTHQQQTMQLRALDDEITSCTQLVDEMGDIRRALGAIEAARDELARAHTHATLLASEHSALSQEDHQHALDTLTAELDALEEQYQAAVMRQAQYEALTQQQTQLRTELERLDLQATQKMHAETQLATAITQQAQGTYALEARQILQDIDDQLATLGYDADTDRDIQHQIDALADVRTQYNELAVLAERVDALHHRRVEAQQHAQQLFEAIQSLQSEVDRLLSTSEQLKPQLETRDLHGQPLQLKQQAESEIRHRTEHVNQLTYKLSAANDAQRRLAPQQSRLAQVAIDVQRHDVLEKAFSGRGIQAMIIRDHAVPALEFETNEILARMSDNQLHLHISTNTVTQAGHMRETIEINVSDATGTRQLEAFSGGEAFRISFALRIALSKLLHQRSGHPLETLIIDEGFGTQDANGRERLVEAINSISSDFRTILVITHIQELRDLFPVQIAFQRVNGSSSWEVLT